MSLLNVHPGKLVFPQKPSSSSSFTQNKILRFSEKNSQNPIKGQKAWPNDLGTAKKFEFSKQQMTHLFFQTKQQ